jgi:hypothetical protein
LFCGSDIIHDGDLLIACVHWERGWLHPRNGWTAISSRFWFHRLGVGFRLGCAVLIAACWNFLHLGGFHRRSDWVGVASSEQVLLEIIHLHAQSLIFNHDVLIFDNLVQFKSRWLLAQDSRHFTCGNVFFGYIY